MIRSILFLSAALIFALCAKADPSKGHFKKTQEVNFEGSEVDGVVRSPDEAYVVQRRGMNFVPLYDVKNHINENIDSSIDYLE
jgi:hypothetical protein